MIGEHVISVQANLCVTQVKPHCGGRSQNYMPPEAADAIKKAETGKAEPAATYPAAK